jgi:hypothetical protein
MSFITEKVQVFQEQTTAIVCDHCKKQYGPNDELFYFNSHHHGWGNDSVDSYKYYHACSPECFKVLLGYCIDKLKSDSHTAEIAEMPYEFAVKLYNSFK